jgi:hypothetical protein
LYLLKLKLMTKYIKNNIYELETYTINFRL